MRCVMRVSGARSVQQFAMQVYFYYSKYIQLVKKNRGIFELSTCEIFFPNYREFISYYGIFYIALRTLYFLLDKDNLQQIRKSDG